MVAALVLLDGGLAVGAGLGVGEHPQAVGRVLVGLAHPGHCGRREEDHTLKAADTSFKTGCWVWAEGGRTAPLMFIGYIFNTR